MMKRAIPFFVLLFFFNQVNGQSIATISQLSKDVYKCSYGNPIIKGYSEKAIYIDGNCNKGSDTVVYDLNNFSLISPGSVNFKELKLFLGSAYKIDSSSKSLLKFKLDGSKWGKGWMMACMKVPAMGSDSDSILVEFGVKESVLYDQFTSYNNPSNPYDNHSYSVGSSSNLVFGISITKCDALGKVIWSNIFARALFRSPYGTFMEGAPLMVQRGTYVYLFYIDRDLNYGSNYINDIFRGDTFQGLSVKYDLICQRINAIDGTTEKFLIDRRPAAKGMYYLQQPIELQDGSFAVLGHAKNSSTFTWYKLTIN